ncbi:endonuclease/exonuclease/phosphatase family protein [Sphingobacterium tabacisoli]|uniref:Endonuclease/exonuclease/phosphatase family protein n=1 Tax=Sphingobacterium tabacisoli TaxID=2044855 RepID=A0ABW5KX44_9SPHI|nr:endonuclease/exonuclease/phosphatase family protein [Sphingobacterium tabacisoli]
MMRLIHKQNIALFFYACVLLFIGSSCSKDSGPTPGEDSKVASTEVLVQLVNENNERIAGEATIIISRKRPDINMLVPRTHAVVSEGELPYKIFVETEARITVLKKGYNPVYKDVVLKPDVKTVPIVLTPKTGLTVLSYNVKDGFEWKNKENMERFTTWVSQLDPDVIVFQELVSFKHGDLSALAKTYGHDFSVLLKEDGYPTGITSKQEIENIERVFITSKFSPYRVHGYINAETSGLNIFAVHFSSQSNDLVLQEAEHVIAQAKMKTTNGPVLISGDFNSISPVDEQLLGSKFWTASMKKYRPARVPFDYRTMNLFEDSGFKDAVTLNGNTFYKASFPTRSDYLAADFLGFRLDYSYLSDMLSQQCDYAEILQDPYTNLASDHYPFLMHFAVK